MNSLYFLIPLGLIILAIAIRLLFWAIHNGQYEDLETEGQRILFDDDLPKKNQEDSEQSDNSNTP